MCIQHLLQNHDNNLFVSCSTWVAQGIPYGFMELSFSKDWLKVQFVTFDKSWSFGGTDITKTVTGGMARGHCWFIPRTIGTSGVECKSSNDADLSVPGIAE